MAMAEDDATRESYTRIAARYAERYSDELDYKPLERQLLGAFMPGATGRLCDLGCGPGHVAAYLHAQGREAIGVDLADGMIEQAQRLYPAVLFVRADMRDLPFASGAFAGIVAFYSLIHIPPAEMVRTLHELRRVLQQDGELLVGFHRGEEVRRVDTMLDEPVQLDFHFFTTQQMSDWITQTGFVVAEVTEREPYPDVEVQTQRAYIRARLVE